MVEFRKLINFGKSAHVVSIPNWWLVKHKLKKGDVVVLDEKDGDLIFSTKTEEVQENSTETTIGIDGKDIAMIQREVVAAYINNINTIILTGKSLHKRVEEIKDVLKNLIALEIVEQTASRIVARDFLNMEQISIVDLLKKMDSIVREMIADSKQSMREDNSQNIIQRDLDVNRLAHLLFRTIKYAFSNEKIARLYKMSPLELLNRWYAVLAIEEIGDCAKVLAEFLGKISMDKTIEKELLGIYSKIEKLYLDVIKAYYENDKNTALALSSQRSEIIKLCDKFYDKYWKLKWIPNVIEQLKEMTNLMQDVGRLVYRYNY